MVGSPQDSREKHVKLTSGVFNDQSDMISDLYRIQTEHKTP
jgi:RNA polymerase-interacting CarD/CdnL/TRCF family regulator